MTTETVAIAPDAMDDGEPVVGYDAYRPEIIEANDGDGDDSANLAELVTDGADLHEAPLAEANAQNGVIFDANTGQLKLSLYSDPLPQNNDYGYWSYDSAARVLTLKDFNVIATGSTALDIRGSGAITLVILGNNSFTTSSSDPAIQIGGLTVTIQGSGQLTASSSYWYGSGISLNSGMSRVIFAGGTVSTAGLTLYKSNMEEPATISGGSLKITGASDGYAFNHGTSTSSTRLVHFYDGQLVASATKASLQDNQLVMHSNKYSWQAGALSSTPAYQYPPNAITGVSSATYLSLDSRVRGFNDVFTSSTFADDIAWLFDQNITQGFNDQTFRPGINVTRESIAAFMHRTAGQPSVTLPAKASFTDVILPGHPTLAPNTFAKEIEWLKTTKVTTGYPQPDGTALFKPGDSLTRESMAAFLYRAAGQPYFKQPAKATFSDVPLGSNFSTEVEWLASTGITNGYAQPDGTKLFKPGATITRESTAAFLHRAYLKNLLKYNLK